MIIAYENIKLKIRIQYYVYFLIHLNTFIFHIFLIFFSIYGFIIYVYEFSICNYNNLTS